jgi:mRNA interferase RelE/StbE
MTWRLDYLPSARAELRALDRPVRDRILRALARLADDPRHTANVTALRGSDRYRMRVGDWRVIYELHDDVLTILVVRVGHRRDVYR